MSADELNALQELNGWDLTSFQGADVQLSFCNEVSVTLGLQAQRVRSVGLRLLPVADPKASQDVVRSGITEYLFSRMNAEVSESSADEAKVRTSDLHQRGDRSSSACRTSCDG